MSKAKTASKNAPTNREKSKDIFYNGKKIKPVKFVGESITYMAGEYEDGNMVCDSAGNPLPWSNLVL